MPPSPKNLPAIIDYWMSYFKRASLLLPGSRPGFNHALKLSHTTIDPKRVHSIGTFSNPEMTYRYSLSSDIPKYSTGVLTALMDELSTDACFRVGLPSAPGLSLQFQTELVDKTKAMKFFNGQDDMHKEVDIINTVSKLGRTIAHTRTDFRCSQTQSLIAFSSHVKYMPTGLPSLDFLLRYPKIHDIYIDNAFRYSTIRVYDEKALSQVIGPHLQFDRDRGEGKPYATFTVTTEHTNPFGAMHGGCQAIVMEDVALDFVRNELSNDDVIVEALQMEFMSPGKQGPIDVYCEVIGTSVDDTVEERVSTMHVRVQLRLQANNRLCTEGRLRVSLV